MVRCREVGSDWQARRGRPSAGPGAEAAATRGSGHMRIPGKNDVWAEGPGVG